MLVDKMLKRIQGPPGLLKVIIGSSLVALLISLAMVGVASAFDFKLNPAIPSAWDAIGAAIFAARMVKPK